MRAGICIVMHNPQHGTPYAKAGPSGNGRRKSATCLAHLFRTLCLLALLSPAAQADPVEITVDKARPAAITHLQLGITHAQHTVDAAAPEAAEKSKRLLAQVAVYHNQHIMGWGADNPNPAPGVYDFRSLDARLALIESMNGIPVLTLCGAPDWMKGGQPNQTDWSKIEIPPLPEHYADFAALAKTIAKRYPKVRHYQVWNEMKGFWNVNTNNWEYQNYTRLYNLTYDALKSVSKEINVGGPYLVIEGTGSRKSDNWYCEAPIRKRQHELIDYWMQNIHGADFIVVDRSIPDPHDKSDYTPAELMGLTETFGDTIRELRRKTLLPVWFAEYYGAKGSPEFTAAHYASIYHHMMLQGAFVALLWSPMQSDVDHGIITDARKPAGPQILPHYAVFKIFREEFPPGTLLYNTESSSPTVEAVASLNRMLLINKSNAQVEITLPHSAQPPLKPYEVRLIERNPDGP